MERIFSVIKQMEADGVIGRYAIGGAVGSIFWLEPVTTKDIDVFFTLPSSPGGMLLTLGPNDEYLLARGYEAQGQHIVIGGWAVEFVPPATALVEEALEQAVERDVNGVATRVFTAEHLGPRFACKWAARGITTGLSDSSSPGCWMPRSLQ